MGEATSASDLAGLTKNQKKAAKKKAAAAKKKAAQVGGAGRRPSGRLK